MPAGICRRKWTSTDFDERLPSAQDMRKAIAEAEKGVRGDAQARRGRGGEIGAHRSVEQAIGHVRGRGDPARPSSGARSMRASRRSRSIAFPTGFTAIAAAPPIRWPQAGSRPRPGSQKRSEAHGDSNRDQRLTDHLTVSSTQAADMTSPVRTASRPSICRSNRQRVRRLYPSRGDAPASRRGTPGTLTRSYPGTDGCREACGSADLRRRVGLAGWHAASPVGEHSGALPLPQR
jgi:hypothetical protein